MLYFDDLSQRTVERAPQHAPPEKKPPKKDNSSKLELLAREFAKSINTSSLTLGPRRRSFNVQPGRRRRFGNVWYPAGVMESLQRLRIFKVVLFANKSTNVATPSSSILLLKMESVSKESSELSKKYLFL